MNPFADIKVEGTEQLLRDFGKYRGEAKKAIKRAVDRTALAVETDARKKLKGDRHIITSRLFSSIHAETKQGQTFSYKNNKGESFDGKLHEPFNEMEAITGTNVHYAPYIEFGTKYISSDPFLGYAAVVQDKKLPERVTEELNKINR